AVRRGAPGTQDGEHLTPDRVGVVQQALVREPHHQDAQRREQRVPTQVDLPLSRVAVVRGAVQLEVDALRLGVHVQVDAAAAGADPYLPTEPRHPGAGEDPQVSPDLEGTQATGGEQVEQYRRADDRCAAVPRRRQRPGVHEGALQGGDQEAAAVYHVGRLGHEAGEVVYPEPGV